MSELIQCTDNLTAKDIIRAAAKTANGLPFYLQTTGLIGELMLYANAASDPAGNEADATTGFLSFGLGGANTFESQGVVKFAGNYSIHSDANATPTSTCRFYMDLNAIGLDIGTNYTVKFNARHIGTGGTWNIGFGSSPNAILTIAESFLTAEIIFQAHESTFTHSLNTRYFICREQSGTNNGGIYFDNFSIMET